MKTRSKALLLSLCAVLLVAASVLGTMAYLTDSETVTNTFTVGQVHLTLDEAKVNPMGQPLDENGKAPGEEGYNSDKLAPRWKPTTEDSEQEYHLLPGHSYTKDPTVTVVAGSEESYVRMMVTVSFTKELTDAQLATSLDGIFLGYDDTKWERIEKEVSADRKTITYEYRYYTTVDGKDSEGKDAAQKLESLFTTIKVPDEYTNEQIAFLGGMNITVEAHAIQADGFANADKAWEAFK